MTEVTIVGVDIAKNVFHLHGAASDGSAVFRKKLSRTQFQRFMASQPACVVAMEACGGAHHWAREMKQQGHEPRLIAAGYVRPFVKRQKNDMADAEAIVEAALRPTMRFVEVKDEAAQARCMLFRVRDQLVRQRSQTVNALRAFLAEFGQVAPVGMQNVSRLAAIVADTATSLPPLARELCEEMLERINAFSERLVHLNRRINEVAAQTPDVARLHTMPGVGPVTALAIRSFAPPLEQFRSGRDFAAWLGLVPRQHSTGGMERLGRMSKMGQNDIRRLLVIGAMAVIRWAGRRGNGLNAWLTQLLARKPKMLVAIALANKMARGLWAMMTRNEEYRSSPIPTA